MRLKIITTCISLIGYLSLSTYSFSQKEEVNLFLPNMTVFYSGYDNLVEVGGNKSFVKKLTLICESCDTVRRSESEPWKWYIKSNVIGQTPLILIDQKGRIIFEKHFNTLPLEAPTMYLDGISAREIVTFIPKQITLNLSASVPTKMGFVVVQWKLELNGKVIEGKSRDLSEKAKELLKSQRKGFVVLTVEYMHPFGKEVTKEIFELNL